MISYIDLENYFHETGVFFDEYIYTSPDGTQQAQEIRFCVNKSLLNGRPFYLSYMFNPPDLSNTIILLKAYVRLKCTTLALFSSIQSMNEDFKSKNLNFEFAIKDGTFIVYSNFAGNDPRFNVRDLYEYGLEISSIAIQYIQQHGV